MSDSFIMPKIIFYMPDILDPIFGIDSKVGLFISVLDVRSQDHGIAGGSNPHPLKRQAWQVKY